MQAHEFTTPPSAPPPDPAPVKGLGKSRLQCIQDGLQGIRGGWHVHGDPEPRRGPYPGGWSSGLGLARTLPRQERGSVRAGFALGLRRLTWGCSSVTTQSFSRYCAASYRLLPHRHGRCNLIIRMRGALKGEGALEPSALRKHGSKRAVAEFLNLIWILILLQMFIPALQKRLLEAKRQLAMRRIEARRR